MNDDIVARPMQLTRFTDYSLRLLLYVTAHRDRLVTLPEVSAAYEISQHHLVKVVQRLTELGLLEGIRGRGGGLRLAREPHEINVAEVVRGTEPHLTLVECFDDHTNECPIEPACGLKRALKQARAAFFAELERYTLADLGARQPALIRLWRRTQ